MELIIKFRLFGKDYMTVDEVKEQVNKLPIRERFVNVKVLSYSYIVQAWSISDFEINRDYLDVAPSHALHAHLVESMKSKLDAELYLNKQNHDNYVQDATREHP